jgi:hypothetical protein
MLPPDCPLMTMTPWTCLTLAEVAMLTGAGQVEIRRLLRDKALLPYRWTARRRPLFLAGDVRTLIEEGAL